MLKLRIIKVGIIASFLTVNFVWQEASAHNGGILVQAQEGKLVTGQDNESGSQQTIGDRAFTLLFPSSLSNDIPSFLSLRNAPSGSESLPVGGQLYWDFLPMRWDGITSNLLYWDGIGAAAEDVNFDVLPQNDISLSLFTQNFSDMAQVDGTPEMVPGKLLGTITNNTVALHAHRWFYLASQSKVPEGIYLFAMQLRMEGFTNTDPFYILAGTDQIPATTLDNLALPWVEERIDALIVQGDYDGDQDADGADFLVWQRQFGAPASHSALQANADGNFDGVINEKDLAVWQAHFGTALLESLQIQLTNIPEPHGLVLFFAGLFLSLLGLRHLS